MVNIYDSFVKCIVQGGLQRFLHLRHLAANDIEVAVPAPDSVQKLLLNLGRNQSYMVMQIIQLPMPWYARKSVCRAGILPKQIVKQTGVVEVLRNGDFQLLLLLRLSAKGQRRVGVSRMHITSR